MRRARNPAAGSLVLKTLCVLGFLCVPLVFSGCTAMLAGAIVYKIATELKSKKTVPDTNQMIYQILAVDETAERQYWVEVTVSVRISKERNAMLMAVDRITVTYGDPEQGKVFLADLDGDGIVDGVRIAGAQYGPPFEVHSSEYTRRRSKEKGSAQRLPFEASADPEDPWFAFVLKDSSDEPSGASADSLNAYPFQERFTIVVVPALEELDFRAPGSR